MIYYLHGLGGSPSDWEKVSERLPGCSLAIPADSISKTIDFICNSVPKENFTLCGYSMGGRLALLATDHLLKKGVKPHALILVSSGFGMPPKDRPIRLAQDHAWAELSIRNPEEFWAKWYDQELFQNMKKLPEEQLSKWMNGRLSLDSNHLHNQLRLLGPANHDELLEPLKRALHAGVKVLYIAGELDKKYSRILSELRDLPLSRKLIEGAGHILPLEKPEELALCISDFLKENGVDHGKKYR